MFWFVEVFGFIVCRLKKVFSDHLNYFGIVTAWRNLLGWRNDAELGSVLHEMDFVRPLVEIQPGVLGLCCLLTMAVSGWTWQLFIAALLCLKTLIMLKCFSGLLSSQGWGGKMLPVFITKMCG